MKSVTSARLALLTLLVVLAAFALPAASALGAPMAAPLAQTNLLANGDFEGGFSSGVPDSWKSWHVEGGGFGKPEFKSGEGRSKTGAKAASYWSSFFRYNGGLYQTVNVTQGQNYRFTISGQGVSNPSAGNPIQMWIGLDTKGGAVASAGSIKWSGPHVSSGAYQEFTVEAVAEAAQVTVFVRSSNDNAVQASESFWDSASLIQAAASASPTTAAPGPTAVPPTAAGSCNENSVPIGSIPKATPQPDGSIVHIVGRCETLYGLFQTYGVSIEQIKALNNLSTNVIQTGQHLTIQGPTAPPTVAPTATTEGQPQSTAVAENNTPQGPPPTDVPTITTGSICVMSYADANGNGSREPEEAKQAGVTFALSSGVDTVETYTTTGDEPYCFEDLSTGSYTVTWAAEGFTPTTDQIWVANVAPGSSLSHDFGVATASAGDEADETESAGGGVSRIVTAAVAALGVIFFLVGISAAAYFLFLRRMQA